MPSIRALHGVLYICGAVCRYIFVSAQDAPPAAPDDASFEIQADGSLSSSMPSTDDQQDDASSCGLIMAESTIRNAGLGMYSLRSFQPGQRIFFGDLVVNIEEPFEHHRLRGVLDHGVEDIRDVEPWWLVENYFWHESQTDSEFETDMDEGVQSLLPGFGMLANSHPGLWNARLGKPKRRNAFNRTNDPGAGAATHLHDVHFLAERPIEELDEIFVDYGQEWFEWYEEHKDPSLYPMALAGDFPVADDIVWQFVALVQAMGYEVTDTASRQFWSLVWGVHEHRDELPDEELRDIDQLVSLRRKVKMDVADDFLRSKPNETWSLLTVVRNASVRVFAALSRSIEDIPIMSDVGTARFSTYGQRRSKEWLLENGRCLDNIQPAISLIPQAGFGAFAARQLPAGSVVGAVPLMHLFRKHTELFDDEDGELEYIGEQLLLNYCYGHPESSLLLFPYAPTVNYVNHAEDANVALQWSTMPQHHSEWFDKMPIDIEVEEEHAGLILELIALRDIRRGEEVLLDYGPAWRAAWNEHVSTWEPVMDGFVPAEVWNRRGEILRTAKELETDPYPETVITVCFVDDMEEIDSDLELSVFRWMPIGVPYRAVAGTPIECDVLDVQGDGGNASAATDGSVPQLRYTIEFDHAQKGIIRLQDVPRDAILFENTPYSRDMYLRSAFRHEIHIPDDIFPEIWKDMEPE